MKKNLFLFSIIYLSTTPLFISGQVINKNPNLIGYFDGRTPCQEIANQLHETTTPACIKIKWRLTLYKDEGTMDSGTYSLEGFHFRGNNILKGNWNIAKGTKMDSNAIVYQLNHPLKGVINFLKADEEVLFFLDKDKDILVGNRNFSYALYRTKIE